MHIYVMHSSKQLYETAEESETESSWNKLEIQ